MRIAEYKQVDTERIETVMPILDEDGNETSETETIVKEIPKMGMVYRDATAEEEAEALRQQAEAEEYERTRPRTVEEQLDELRAEVAELKSFVNAMGKTELVGKGTEAEPFEFVIGMDLIPNAFYSYNGQKFVWMGKAEKATAYPVDDGGSWVLW